MSSIASEEKFLIHRKAHFSNIKQMKKITTEKKLKITMAALTLSVKRNSEDEMRRIVFLQSLCHCSPDFQLQL